MNQFLTTTIIIIIIIVVFQNLKKVRINEFKDEQGNYIIKFPRSLIWFGGVMAIVFLSSLIVLLITTKDFYEFSSFSWFTLSLLFSCLSILVTLVFLNWEITFNEEGFVYRTFLGKNYRFLFSDVKKCSIGTEVIVLKANNKKLFLDPHLMNVKKFLFLLNKDRTNNNKFKVSEIRLTKGNFWVGLCSLAFSIYISIMLVIPNNSVDEIVTSWWGYLLLILINYILYIYTTGSLKWRISLYESSFTYVTYFKRKYEFKYSDVKSIKVTSNFIIMKVKNKYFFIDTNAIGIENFLKRVG